jgi:TPR repeat protein
MAADQNDANAQFNLGFAYEMGEGIQKNQTEAVAWYRKAADKGHASAQFNLAFDYETGMGVGKDFIQAYKWYKLASESFSSAEKDQISRAVSNLDRIEKLLTPTQLADAKRLARSWKPIK